MNICVFSSSSNAIADVYVNEAIDLARLIGQAKYCLINGGSNVGTMDVVTREANNHGAKTIGIIPEKLRDFNLASVHAHEIIVSGDMMERKAKMRELSDAFIALAGGFGTLEEILEVITLKQLGYHHKAIVFINTNGFYDDLFRQFEKSFDEKFAKESYRKLYFIAENATEAMNYLQEYQPEETVNKWFEVPKR
ncbi:MAG TPA: TIGR00730 family Rossman fold protein [Prolixibacteraceae bacterium]|nr:MAG: Rossman fold protein, TIGR00730 family [Bacteroidetes bacterium GWB2_41_8]HCY40113.1 TIGR00730 family Rossman fold protein [Prolixibacteraceae bacterium]